MFKSKISSHCSLPLNSKTKKIKDYQKIEGMKKILNCALGQVRNFPSKAQIGRQDSPTLGKEVSTSSETESMKEVIENLHRGYVMLKHSEKTDQPHMKFVYLSEDNNYLCWKSLDKEDEKKILLDSIQNILTEGLEHYLKSLSVRHISRCLIIMSQQRNLQLESVGEYADDENELLKNQLKLMIKHSQAMRLNYKQYYKSH